MPTSIESLRKLLRLRRADLEAAHQLLIASVDAEAATARAERAAEAAIRHEERVASALDAPDAAVEAFARWLPRGRSDLARANADHERKMATTMRSRARVSLARAAVESTEQLLETQARARHVEAARRLQAELDEVGATRRRR